MICDCIFEVLSVVRRFLFFVFRASFVKGVIMIVSVCLKSSVVVLLFSSVYCLFRIMFSVAGSVKVLRSLTVTLLLLLLMLFLLLICLYVLRTSLDENVKLLSLTM